MIRLVSVVFVIAALGLTSLATEDPDVTAKRAQIADLEAKIGTLDKQKDLEAHGLFRGQQARLHVELGETNVALQIYTQLIGTNDTSPELVDRAVLYQKLGQDDRALADYRRFLRAGASIDEAFTKFAELADGKLPDDELITEYNRAAGRMRGNAIRVVWEPRAKAYERTKQFERAIADYRLLLREDSRADWVRQKLNDLEKNPDVDHEKVAEKIVAEAEAAAKLGNHLAAKERSRTALALNPDSLPGKITLGRAMSHLPGEQEDALLVLTEARTSASDYERSKAETALHEVAGRLADEQAATIAKEPPTTNDEWDRALRNLIKLEVNAARLDAALATCKRLIKLEDASDAHILCAQVHEIRGEYEKAVAEYKTGLRWPPSQSPDNWMLFHEMRLAHQDYKGIIADCTELLVQYREQTLAKAWLIDAHLALGNQAETLKLLDAWILENPWEPMLRWQRLQLLRTGENWQRLIPDCNWLVLWESPGYGRAISWMAQTASKAGKLNELLAVVTDTNGAFTVGEKSRYLACGVVESLIPGKTYDGKNHLEWAKDSSGSEAVWSYARAQIAAKSYGTIEAIQHLGTAIRYDGGKADEFWINSLAVALTNSYAPYQHIHEEKIKGLELLHQRFPSNQTIRACLDTTRALPTPEKYPAERLAAMERLRAAEAKFDDFVAAEKRGDVEAALAGYASILAEQPDHFWPLVRRSVLNLVKGDSATVFTELQAAALDKGRNIQNEDYGHLNLNEQIRRLLPHSRCSKDMAAATIATVFRYAHLRPQGRQIVEKYLTEFPGNLGLIMVRGDLAMDAFDAENADKDFSTLIEVMPKSPIGYARRAEALRWKKLWSQAYAHLDKAIELDPEQPQYYIQKAEMLLRSDDPQSEQKAIQILEQSNRIKETARTWDRLRHCYSLVGRHFDSLQATKRAHDLDPAKYPYTPDFQNMGNLTLFLNKVHEGYVKGEAEFKARQAREQEARTKAAEAARQEAARAAEAATAAAREANRESGFAKFVQALATVSANYQPDTSISDMARANRAAGARLQSTMDTEARRNAHLHEVERRFGYYSKSAVWERDRR